jgi:hypothetical protein
MPELISEFESPIYRYKFSNPTDLLDIVNKIGPEGLFSWLFPVVPEWRSSEDAKHYAAIKELFVETSRHLMGQELSMETLFRSLYSASRVDREEMHDLHNSRRVMQFIVQRNLAFVAYDVLMLDNMASEFVRLHDSGAIDVDALRRMHQVSLRNDHRYIADEFVRRITRGADRKDRVRELVYISIGRIALKGCRQDILWCLKQDTGQIRHVVDWITSAVSNDAPWLKNLDDKGRPKKLMKFGSMDAMVAEADKDMRKKLAGERVSLGEGDEEVFADDKGDYFIVRLKTMRALDVESGAMRHCLGHGGYDHYLKSDTHLFLSLRDRSNQPHATIEVDRCYVVQFRGKANSEPKDSYREVTLGLLTPHGIKFRKVEPLGNPCREIMAGELRQAWQ